MHADGERYRTYRPTVQGRVRDVDDGAFLHRVLFAVRDHDAILLQDDYFEA